MMQRFIRLRLLFCFLLLATLLAACGELTATPATPQFTPTPPKGTDLNPPVANATTPTATPDTRNQHTLFVLPDDTAKPVLDLINNAKTSLDVKIYLLSDPAILDALKNAAKRGVKVRCMLEPKPVGSETSNAESYKVLETAGVQVKWSNPAFRLTHEKSIVADSRAAAIMTTNLTRTSFTRNREYGIITTLPSEVKEVKTGFEADWARSQFQPSVGSNLVWSNNNARAQILAFIASAQKTLVLEQLAVQDAEIEYKLVEAVRRGVQVRIVEPKNNQDGSPVTDRPGEKYLMGKGVMVRLNDKLYIHAKLYLADNKKALLGSINASTASLDDNRELSIIVDDSEIVSRLADIFEKDWKVAKLS